MSLIVCSICLEVLISWVAYAIFEGIYYENKNYLTLAFLAIYYIFIIASYLRVYYEIGCIDPRFLFIKSMAVVSMLKFTIDMIFSTIITGEVKYSTWSFSFYCLHNFCLIIVFYHKEYRMQRNA